MNNEYWKTCECGGCVVMRAYCEQIDYIGAKYKREIEALPYRLPPDEDRRMRRKMMNEMNAVEEKFRASKLLGVCFSSAAVLKLATISID
jgi:hypothetical protein